ncbi:MAG: thioredoxin domain-containing protein [Bacteroidota bacterium]|nr:thioredoxin domain-containing protein [Bacteroidota bacterium]MDP4234098.1 thioredoxin domain-containing protein [Bacteroidota bacterium]MDP4243039.1 thioredoxin domain-containing protein [Bacteroidota bacterium]MDP4287465.1 thioredoxin domain-containing protein [Bacteroidota bacterium]
MRINRLSREKSPYLLQHAHNPVDWYPWGEEAFEKARMEEKPIFLSIGYSTCHWCHVMERESFEDETIARVLNEHFIPIKVDREERPDVDHVYMSALQAMSGAGGWPMSVFLTPDLKPFFAGTYFPPRPMHGRPSFMQVLERLHEVWESEREKIIESSEDIIQQIADFELRITNEGVHDSPRDSTALIRTSIEKTYRNFEQSFDPAEGGFGGAPKFPRPVQFDFLFGYWSAFREEKTRDMALFTLRKMAFGGMHDQLGGGFHRYSVDRYWRVSHFEKMLYDQAQLVNSYIDAWQITHDEFEAGVARSAIEYVLRDLTHPDGGFYSAEDADSEGEEGKFYVWTLAELETILGKDAAAISALRFGVTAEGNFEHGKNVLYLARSIEETAAHFGASETEIRQTLGGNANKLIAARAQRVRPHLDDKILTSWNGLMIGAMARAGSALSIPRYVEAATKSADFIWNNLRVSKSGLTTLLHRWRDGEARYVGYLEDYAFLIKGFLELYEATFDDNWLRRAIELQDEQDRTLYDEEQGGYFMSRNAPDVIVRSKPNYDGAEPSGNSIAVQNLFRLSHFTEDNRYAERARQTLSHFAARVEGYPYAMPEMMASAFWDLVAPMQIVFAGDDTSALKYEVTSRYLPVSVMMSANHGIAPFAKSLPVVDGKGTVYVCHHFRCERPVTSALELAAILDEMTKHKLNR